MEKTKKSNNPVEIFMHGLMFIFGMMSVAFVLFISIFLIVSGVPAIGTIGIKDFLLGTVWASTAADPKFGILPFILTSFWGMAGAIILAVPIGLLCSVYLSKIAKPKVAAVIRSAVELLAGIPSVVYGLVGMIVLVPFVIKVFHVANGSCMLTAILVLAVMILPSIISVSETALNAVPKEYEEASLALGATYTETVFKVSFPAARSGIAAAIVQGVGRAIGEAMAVMMVSGNVANMPSLFQSVRFLTTAVASEMSYFIFVMLIMFILNFMIKRDKK